MPNITEVCVAVKGHSHSEQGSLLAYDQRWNLPPHEDWAKDTIIRCTECGQLFRNVGNAWMFASERRARRAARRLVKRARRKGQIIQWDRDWIDLSINPQPAGGRTDE